MKTQKLMVLSLLGLVALSGCKPKPSSSSAPSSEDDKWTWSETTPEVVVDKANGVKNFASSPGEERAEILRLMETYTIDNFLGGIPYRDNSAYVLYNTRLTIPADDYVVGYGYGVGEATINAPLTAEGITVAYNMYYHTWNSTEPGTINYLDGQDSVSGDLHAMVSAGYWSTRFNSDKSGYEWYPLLADDVARPIPLNLDSNGQATKWRVPLKVGGDLKYDTLSTKPAVAAFKNRAVALEDYLTPFKLMLENGWFRATDFGSRASGFVGFAAELKKDVGVRDINNVQGIKLNADETAIEFEFLTPKTPFYAMYNLASSLFSPIPESFVDAIGGPEEYGKPNIDSILSVGVYTLEQWELGKQVVFKKNPTHIEASRYSHEGYVFTVLKDNTVAFNEFLAGKLDSAGVPSAQLQAYKSDPRARQTKGDTVWKLQTNAADQELWDQLFGPEGSVSPGSEWELKPVMSNRNFLNGVYFSLDRSSIAETTGSRPAQGFLSEAYMVDPEGGLSWRGSDEGIAVIADRLPESNGFSKELAGLYFQDAMKELVWRGKYPKPVAGQPDIKIELSVIYQSESQAVSEGGPLEVMIENAFNDAVDGFELDIVSYATTNWMDAYYAAMYGEFDFAFGSISGNTLDPINFMDTVASDNRSGFTLSWGTDTSLPSNSLRFKGETYSFNALLEAAQGFTVVNDGKVVDSRTFEALEFAVGSADGLFDVFAAGTYYVDQTGEYVVEADEEGFLQILFYDEDGKGIPGSTVVVDMATWEDGEWTAEAEDIAVPEDAYYMDILITTKHTYKGVVDYSELLFETYWFYFDPTPAA